MIERLKCLFKTLSIEETTLRRTAIFVLRSRVKMQKYFSLFFFLSFFLFWKSNFKIAPHLEKGLFLTYFSHLLVVREKTPSAYISNLHTYTYFAHLLTFFALPILQKLRIYHVWFLFGVTPDVDFFIAPFWSNQ